LTPASKQRLPASAKHNSLARFAAHAGVVIERQPYPVQAQKIESTLFGSLMPQRSPAERNDLVEGRVSGRRSAHR